MDLFKSLTSATKSSVTAFFDRFRSRLGIIYRLPMLLAQKARGAVKKVFDFALGKPAKAEDYVQVNNTMLSKSMVVKIVIIAGALIFVLIRFVYPYLDGWLWTASVVVNSNKYHSFSGKANVKTADGTVIYRGEMENGSITGEGNVYDRDGNLLYSGQLAAEKYEGEGSTYENGVLVYTGQFSNNLYNGSGKLYYEDGTKLYVGNFLDGRFEGEGTMFHTNGREAYVGAFAHGQYHGMGRLYYPNGNIQYDGLFEDGVYQGAGRQYYESGAICFDGYFDRGSRNGEGKLYNEDSTLLYEGNFLRDQFDGHGRLMGSMGRLLYEGGFRSGLYEGEGRLMTRSGNLLYSGGFVAGKYNGFGQLMDADSGRTLYEGSFFQGIYHGLGKLYSNTGVLLFNGEFIMGEIDYLQFVDCTRNEIVDAFGKGQFIVYDDSFLFMQPGLDIGFLFYFSDGIEEPRVHRILILGRQQLMRCEIGMPLSKLIQYYDETFTDYYLEVEGLEFTALGYVGNQMRPGSELYCVKMIAGEAFVRAFSDSPEGVVLYYEIGGV